MSDNMRRISFYHGKRNKQDILHVETDGCIVNIQVGLHDRDGRQVTSVRILPDDESRGGDGDGRIWVQDGSRVIRLHEDETELTGRTVLTVAWDGDQQDIAQLALHRMVFSAPDSEVSPNMRESARTALRNIQAAREA